MSVPVATGLTYDDLSSLPQDDRLRRELVDGELYGTPSPTTRRLDLIEKRNLYEREGVAEYWFVDLEVDRFDVHRLDPDVHRLDAVVHRLDADVHRLDAGTRYGQPESLGAGDTLNCLAAPGFELSVAQALGL